MGWTYHDPENGEYLDRLRAASGFGDTVMLEKLVLDFEMHYRLKSEFSMVVRGGMAALLHAGDPIQRLSEDMDVLTSISKTDVISIVGRLNDSSGEMEVSVEGEPTSLPDRLVHFRARCPSSTSWGRCSAKIDVLCSVDRSMLQYAETLRSPRLGPIGVRHDIDVLSRGALIADKLCTLTSPETIGLRSLRNFPKQVHDVAMLLRGASPEDLLVLFASYPRLLSSILDMHGKACPAPDAVASTYDKCARLLDFSSDALLSAEYRRHYARFQSRYVRNRRAHTEDRHVDEILLVMLCARHLGEHEAGADAGGRAGALHGTVREYVRAAEAGGAPSPDPGILQRAGRRYPGLAGLRRDLTAGQWILLLGALGPQGGPPARAGAG